MADPTTEFVDYYAVLGVRESASDVTIEKAINELQRKWRSRQNSPDPRRRSEAEEMMRTIEAAEVTLTDRTRRKAFDKLRASRLGVTTTPAGGSNQVQATRPRVVETLPPPDARQRTAGTGSAGSGDPGGRGGAQDSTVWVTQSRDLLRRNANEAARVAAQRAVDASPADPETWSLLGLSLLALGRTREAEIALKEAVTLSPTSHHRINLAKGRMALNQYALAFESLNAAYRRDPGNENIKVAMIQCYVDSGNPGQGLALAEQLAQKHPAHGPYQRQLAWVLYKMTVVELTETTPGLYLITSPDQAEVVQTNLRRAWNLRYDDEQLKAEIQKWYHVGESAMERKFTPPGSWLAWIVAFMAGLVFGYAFFWAGFFYLLGYAAFFGITRFRPQWQLNRRACESSGVTKWGK